MSRYLVENMLPKLDFLEFDPVLGADQMFNGGVGGSSLDFGECFVVFRAYLDE